MKRQYYYPSRIGDQVTWLKNYADKLPEYATELELTPAEITAGVADALRAAYALGDWLGDVRDFAPAGTAAVDHVLYGTGTAVAELPEFSAPDGGTAMVALVPGTLPRVFTQAAKVKLAKGYTEAIGKDLGIVGAENTMPQTTPKMTLKVELGSAVIASAFPSRSMDMAGFTSKAAWREENGSFSPSIPKARIWISAR